MMKKKKTKTQKRIPKSIAPSPGRDLDTILLQRLATFATGGTITTVLQEIASHLKALTFEEHSNSSALNSILQLLAALTESAKTDRENSANWQLALVQSEINGLLDLLKTASRLIESLQNAITEHHQPTHSVGCTICINYDVQSQVDRLQHRIKTRRDRIPDDARKHLREAIIDAQTGGGKKNE